MTISTHTVCQTNSLLLILKIGMLPQNIIQFLRTIPLLTTEIHCRALALGIGYVDVDLKNISLKNCIPLFQIIIISLKTFFCLNKTHVSFYYIVKHDNLLLSIMCKRLLNNILSSCVILCVMQYILYFMFWKYVIKKQSEIYSCKPYGTSHVILCNTKCTYKTIVHIPMFHIIIYLRFGILNSQCLPTYRVMKFVWHIRVYHDSALVGIVGKENHNNVQLHTYTLHTCSHAYITTWNKSQK